MGDPVNLASRLESINKLYGTTPTMSGQTLRKVANRVRAREIDKVHVTGKSEPVTVHEQLGLAGDHVDGKGK